MKKSEIENLIEEQTFCRIAFKGVEYPYIAPFQYVYMDNALYFQFTNYGKKMRLIERDSRVCLEIEKFHPDMSEYKVVALRGKLKVVKEPKEREAAIRRLREEGGKKLSTNFLAAHGIKKEEGWSSFTTKKPLVIVKLESVAEEIGLKSPYS